ncbi:MAG TPA: ATP-binding protein, partial [Longimicrobiaceae bacterium]|nr:ATP-binding protein [Longimicrobiaceae bacterium]
VLERVRAHDDEVTVVMITGEGGTQAATQAVRRGADGYVEQRHLCAGEAVPFLCALQQALVHRAGNVAQRQLEAVKADFYSMVTHDLRNPAGNVAGVLKLLLSGKAGTLTPRQEQLVSLADASAAKLVGLIDDYLDFATIDARFLRMDRRPADLRALAEEAARQAGPRAGARQQAIELDLPRQPVRGRVDAERLGQVLENLLSNAIKYTPEGGGITLSLAERGGCAVFTVKDTGIGIAPEQLPALFRRYGRVGGESTRGIRGTGLGLLIVKEIVKAHGGRVWAASAGVPGKGTTFTVTIPLDGSEE